jgi:protein archease
MGFQEIDHTADCAIRVWAKDLPSLIAEAARGMNLAAGVKIQSGSRVRRAVSVRAADAEGLLVQFLTELIFAQEHDNLGFDGFEIQMSRGSLSGRLAGGLLESVAKPIKAVTYNNLSIEQTARGYETEIVFDV